MRGSAVNERWATDRNGYLLFPEDWQPEFAARCAAADGVLLGAEHYAALECIRRHYFERRSTPSMRVVLRCLAATLGPEAGTSRYLYRLFPAGFSAQACRYAGIPKPASCI